MTQSRIYNHKILSPKEELTIEQTGKSVKIILNTARRWDGTLWVSEKAMKERNRTALNQEAMCNYCYLWKLISRVWVYVCVMWCEALLLANPWVKRIRWCWESSSRGFGAYWPSEATLSLCIAISVCLPFLWNSLSVLLFVRTAWFFSPLFHTCLLVNL